MNMNESLLNKLKQIKSLTEAADPIEFEDDIEFSNAVDVPDYGDSKVVAGDMYTDESGEYTWVGDCGKPNPDTGIQVWEAQSEDDETVYFTVDTLSNEVLSGPMETLEEALSSAGINITTEDTPDSTSVYLTQYHKEVPITIVNSEDELPQGAVYKSTDFDQMLDVYRIKNGDFYGIKVDEKDQPEFSDSDVLSNSTDSTSESLTERLPVDSPESEELDDELTDALAELDDLGPEVADAFKDYLSEKQETDLVILSDEGRRDFIKWLEDNGITVDPDKKSAFLSYFDTEIPEPLEEHKNSDILMTEIKKIPEIFDLLVSSLPDWDYWVTQTNVDTNDGSKYPVLVIKFNKLDEEFYQKLREVLFDNGHYDVFRDKGSSTIFIYPYEQETNESLTEDLAIQLIAPAEEAPVANVECPACADACVLETATKVMAAYQNANKWMDILKEFLFTDLGCVFFSSYIHNLAHTMPSRFDSFGDILHTIDMKIPYPETAYIPEEPNNVDDVFALTFGILDDIKKSLNEFIDCTDKKYHGMACAAEDLLNDIEGEYVPLYKMQKSWKSYNGDHIRWDKWVGQYTKERDNLIESVNEDTVKTKDGEWTNKGDEGTHGKFRTKKEADAQRKAMYANGYKG